MDRVTVIPNFATAQTVDDIKRILTQSWSEMANLVNNCFTLYVQSTQPTIPNNTTSLWQDTTNTPNEYYLVSNFGGTHQIIQLTAALPIDPLHKHSKLWASDGTPVCITVDATGNSSIDGTVTIPDMTSAGFVKNNASGVLSGGNAIASEFQKARAYRNAAQNLTGTQDNKIALDTDSYDPANITDLTNNRIKPTLAGYYQVNGQVSIADLSPTDFATISLKKTGNTVAYGNVISNASAGDIACKLVVADLIYFDGANDYIELWSYVSATMALSVSTGDNYLSIVGPF